MHVSGINAKVIVITLYTPANIEHLLYFLNYFLYKDVTSGYKVDQHEVIKLSEPIKAK